MKNIILVAALLVGVHAQASESVTLIGTTINNCGKWNKTKPSVVKDFAKTWVFAYISALNAKSDGQDVLKNTDAETVESGVDRYCANNPYKSLQNAAEGVFDELNKLENTKGKTLPSNSQRRDNFRP